MFQSNCILGNCWLLKIRFLLLTKIKKTPWTRTITFLEFEDAVYHKTHLSSNEKSSPELMTGKLKDPCYKLTIRIASTSASVNKFTMWDLMLEDYFLTASLYAKAVLRAYLLLTDAFTLNENRLIRRAKEGFWTLRNHLVMNLKGSPNENHLILSRRFKTEKNDFYETKIVPLRNQVHSVVRK